MPSASDGHIKEALLWPGNLVLLALAAALAAFFMSPVPLLVAAGGECLYLAAAPSIPGFRRRVFRKRQAERRLLDQAAMETLLEELSPNQRDSYFALKDLRDRILANYGRLPGGDTLARSSTERLDGLLTSFLRLLHTLNDYRRYLSSTDRKALERDLAELRVELAGGEAGSAAVQEVKKRRVEILEKRLERFDKAGESREVISQQLASIDDFLRLLHEQSITLRDPEVVGRQLETLSMEVQATDETVREMEKFIAFSEEVNPVAPPERQRVR